MNVGGLELDFRLGDATCSTWIQSDGLCDIAVADFFGREIGGEPEDSPSRFMVSLPMGSGLGPTVEQAAKQAAMHQRAELDALRVLAKSEAAAAAAKRSNSWTGPEGDAWIAAGGTLD